MNNCSLCKKKSIMHGHNAAPLAADGKRCCDDCNHWVVLARIGASMTGKPINKEAWIARIRSGETCPIHMG